MKPLFILSLILVFSLSSCTQNTVLTKTNVVNDEQATSKADSLAITKLILLDFTTIFKRGDNAPKLANFFLDDAETVLHSSSWIYGKDAIQEKFSYLKTFPEGRRLEFKLHHLGFLNSEAAWINVGACEIGGLDKIGEPLKDYCDRATFILKKQDGIWKVASLNVFAGEKK